VNQSFAITVMVQAKVNTPTPHATTVVVLECSLIYAMLILLLHLNKGVATMCTWLQQWS
jgi:hypothetical protein